MKNPGLIKNPVPKNICPPETEEKVIALAAGEIKDYEERLNILTHVISCEWCKLLFEDTLLLISAHKNDNEANTLPFIKLGIKENRIIPLTAPVSPEYSAAMLSEEKNESAEFRLNHDNKEITLCVIKSKDGLDFDLSANNKDAKFYLIGDNGFNTAFQYNNIARFENVKPGRYALTLNLKDFIFIEIIKD